MTAESNRRRALAFNALSAAGGSEGFVKLSTRLAMSGAALDAAGLDELMADRDRYKAALEQVLGQFWRATDSDNGLDLHYFDGSLSQEEMDEARAALAGGGTDA
jgi:hypothetical protein